LTLGWKVAAQRAAMMLSLSGGTAMMAAICLNQLRESSSNESSVSLRAFLQG
jgi:hypothetical protein